jgi:hypothetical protein
MADDNIKPIGGRINLVNPNNFNYQSANSIFGETNYNMSVPIEDLCIIVELATETKPRTLLNTSLNKNTSITTNNNNLTVKFIDGQKFPPNEGTYLTTQYTELNTELNQDIYESLGITDINIDFNSSYAPMVNINFVDIRGGALFQNGAKSKFNVLFKLPYPIFALTVKGYYGKPVKYCLHLIKCNTKFNSQSGNFEISAQFVGYTYAMLNDMIMGYLKAAEYTKLGQQKAKDRGVMTIYDFMYEVSQIDKVVKEKLLTDDDADVKNQQVIFDMKQILGDMETVVSTLITKLTTDNVIKIFEIQESVSSIGIILKDSMVSTLVPFDANFKIDENNESYKKIKEFITEYDTNIKILFEKYNQKSSNTVELQINDLKKLNAVTTKWFGGEDYGKQTNRDYIVKQYYNCDNNCVDERISRLKKANKVPIDDYNANNSNNQTIYTIDLTDVLFEIKELKLDLIDTEKQIREKLGEKLKNLITKELGVDTSVRGTLNVFTTAIEIFLEMLYEVSASASDPNNTERYNELKKFKDATTNGLDNTKQAFDRNYVYPWPEYHEDDVEKYLGAPGVLENPLSVNEIKFTEELYKAMVEVYKKEEDLASLISGEYKSWISFNPLDSILFNTDETNPYLRIENGANHDVLAKVIALRAVGFLGYANRGLSVEEIERAAQAEAALILERFKDDTKIINALNVNYNDINKYAATKGKHISKTEYNVFTSIDDLTYTYYNNNDSKALPIKIKYKSDGIDDKITTNITAIVAANDIESNTGWNIFGNSFKNDSSSFIILDSKKPNGSSLESGVNYDSISTTAPVTSNALVLSELINMNSKRYSTPEQLKSAGFNIGAGKFGVQDFLTINYSNASYRTDSETFKYDDVETAFYSIFYDNTQVTENNLSDLDINPRTWTEFKTSSLSGTSISDIPSFVSPSLCKKRAPEYKNTFDLTTNSAPVAMMDVNNEERAFQLMSTYAFREEVGNNIRLLKRNEDNDGSSVSFPYLTFGVWIEDEVEYQIPLFGSAFYYAQSKIGKAFLFLHCLPWKGLARQLSSYDTNFTPQESSNTGAGLFVPNEISAIFGNRTGFIQAPKLWLAFIGGILKRWRQGNVTNTNAFNDGLDTASDFKIDISQTTPGSDILRWEFSNNIGLIPGVTTKDSKILYPKTYQYLRWQSVDPTGGGGKPSGNPYDISSSMSFIGNGRLIYSDKSEALAYSKIDETIIRLPRAVQDEFIRYFDEFVENDFDGIRNICEIRQKSKKDNPSDGSAQDFLSLYNSLVNATTTGSNNIGSIPISTLSDLVADNGGSLTNKYNIFSIIYNNRTQNSTASATKFENIIFFEYKDSSQPSEILKQWMFNKTIIANNSYLLWNQVAQSEAKDSLATIKIDKDKEFTPYFTTIIKSIKDASSGNTQTIKLETDAEQIKLEIYRRLKKIYDTWIAGSSSEKDSPIFQCCYTGVGDRLKNDEKIKDKRGDTTVRLIDSFRFIDRAYRDIGDKFQVNPISANKQLLDSNESSFYDFVGRILNDYNFDFIALPNFIDYNDPKEIQSVFTPYPYYEVKTNLATSGPSFVCVYVGQTSTKLDFGDDADYPNDGFDLNDETTLPADFKEEASDTDDKAAAFVVRYGHQNQNIFKDIILDQAEHGATAESLMITDNISNTLSQTSRSYIGQNLYDVYSVRSYKAEIEMMGDAMIQPMMYFQLDNIPMFHGAYLITKVKHSIKPNHMTTSFSGTRIKGVSTPILDAATLYESLIDTYGIPVGDGTGTIDTAAIRAITKGKFPPIVATIRENGGENGDIAKGKITRTAIDFPTGVSNNVRNESIEILTEAVAPLKAMLTEWITWMKSQGFKGENGIYVTINSAFRTIAIQKAVKSNRGKAAATPGSSRHGWGIAIDFQFKDKNGQNISNYVNKVPNNSVGFDINKNPAILWLFDNSYRFGWIIPPELRVGASLDEFWHWEYHGNAAKCILEKSSNIRGYSVKVDKNYDASVTNPKKLDGTIPDYKDCSFIDAKGADGGSSKYEGYKEQKVSQSDTIRNEYIPAQNQALPNVERGPKLLMQAQAQLEGFKPGTKAYRTNNPGNVYPNGNKNGFPTLKDGIQAQWNMVLGLAYANKSKYYKPTNTLFEYLSRYAPPSDGNDPTTYTNFVINYFKNVANINITSTTTLQEIKNI